MFNIHSADIPHSYRHTLILLKLLFSIFIKNLLNNIGLSRVIVNCIFKRVKRLSTYHL
jgi:hypothetical protein